MYQASPTESSARKRGVVCTPVYRSGRAHVRCVRACDTYDAKAACDLLAEPYRIDDHTPPRERAEILSIVARAAVDLPSGGEAIWPEVGQRPCIHPAIAEACRAAMASIPRYRSEGALMVPTEALSAFDRSHVGSSTAEGAAAVLRWIQDNVQYRQDKEGEWYAGPVWTLRNGGDCTTMAPVLVAMLAATGVPSQLVWINQPGFQMNHFACRVLLNGRLYWADPSLRGARLGEEPDAAAHRLSMGSVLGA